MLLPRSRRLCFSDWQAAPPAPAIRRSRLKKKTLFEMDADEDVIRARVEYMRLAEALWNSTEALAPAPLPDREIFELLGFD